MLKGSPESCRLGARACVESARCGPSPGFTTLTVLLELRPKDRGFSIRNKAAAEMAQWLRTLASVALAEDPGGSKLDPCRS